MVKERGRAHHLIEEWMLAANQAVARRLFQHVIQQKHREILLHTNTDVPNNATITATSDNMAQPVETDKPKGYRTFSMGTVLRRHPPPRASKMDELVRRLPFYKRE